MTFSTLASMLGLLALAGPSLLCVSRAETSTAASPLMQACAEEIEDLRVITPRRPQTLVEALTGRLGSALTLVHGIQHLSDDDLRWLDERCTSLQGVSSLIFELTDQEVERLSVLAPNLSSRLARLDSLNVSLAEGLSSSLGLASVLPVDPEADRVTDELIHQRTAGWSTRPLQRWAQIEERSGQLLAADSRGYGEGVAPALLSVVAREEELPIGQLESEHDRLLMLEPIQHEYVGWLAGLYDLVASEAHMEAIDRIYERMETELSKGCERADQLLRELDPERLNAEELVAVLISTLEAKDRLPNRKGFIVRSRPFLDQESEGADEILRGLE